MDILNTKIKSILTEKNTKIIPENIKSGVNILGINGNVTELNGETKTVTPTTSSQTITPTGTGKNALTQVTVNAVTSAIDNNIQAGNIKKDVNILGVTGTYEGIDTSDANAVANDIVTGKTAYVNGQKLTGTYTGIIPTGTKQISITQNGTTTEDVTNYANAQITTNVVNQDYEDALVAFGVTEDLTDGIEALTTYSNEITGESDTTLSDAVASLADGYGQGGGYTGLEYVINGTGTVPISEVIWHGSGKIRNSCCQGLFGSVSKNIPISFPDHPTSVDINSFASSRLRIDWDTLGTELVVIASNAFRINYITDCSTDIVNLPKFTGMPYDGITPQACFSYQSAKAPSTYYFDTMQNIPREIFTNCGISNLSVTFGSIGHTVQSAGLYPFRNPQSTASGTVTTYTTGEYLDTIRTAIEAGNTVLTFVYKASEATTYNGTSYNAGDTISI